MLCNCPRCQRLKFLEAKHDRAERILETGEGALSLWLVDENGEYESQVITADDGPGLRDVMKVLKTEIEGLRATPHQRRRTLRRWIN